MILSIGIVSGFQKEIRKRVIGFGSHIQIENLDANNSFETNPVIVSEELRIKVKNIRGVESLQAYGTKPGLINTKKDIHGVVFKGVESDYDWTFFTKNLIEGRTPSFSDASTSTEIIISKKVADLLNISLNDPIGMVFIDEPPRRRRFDIVGIFETSLEDFDEQFIIGDIKQVQKLYGWSPEQVSGYEIYISDYKYIDAMTYAVREQVGYTFMEDGSRLKVTSIKNKYPQIFDWLNLLDMNVWVILVIMTIVSVINMTSVLIIIILDRIKTIGLLKAIGSSNKTIREIFLVQAGYILTKGLLWGNVIAISVGLLQENLKLIKLEESSYFIDYAPVNLKILWIIGLNLAFIAITLIALLLPATMISRVQPVKTLRYE